METTNQQDTTITQLRNDPTSVRDSFRVWERIVMAIIAAILAGLLLVAARLTPDPTGMGTHQQLGFPPCSSTVWFGVRCPACGMTTSWALLMDGMILQALGTNVGGVLLALTAMWTSIFFTVYCVRGIRIQTVWFQTILLSLLIIGIVSAGLQWAYRLYIS